MAFAPNYTPTTDFSQDEANNVSGRSTARTANLDAELNNISTSINALNNNLKALQRSDNELKDGVVKMASLSNEVAQRLAAIQTNTSGLKIINAPTFADIPEITSQALVNVIADETNAGLSTIYFYNGATLNWIPSVEV